MTQESGPQCYMKNTTVFLGKHVSINSLSSLLKQLFFRHGIEGRPRKIDGEVIIYILSCLQLMTSQNSIYLGRDVEKCPPKNCPSLLGAVFPGDTDRKEVGLELYGGS